MRLAGLKAAAAGIAVYILLCLCSCGEMDSIFPVSQTYQVSALVSRVSIDECALIKKDDRIQPFFVQPVTDDPDLRGLTVILKNAEGFEIGTPLIYQTENKIPEANNETAYAGSFEYTEQALDTEESAENGENIEAETDEESLGEKSFFYEESISEENIITETVEGGGETENERLFIVRRMDQTLPAFSLPETLEPGAYVMIFEAFGEGQRPIAKTEKSFYYLADKTYDITDIKASLPGFSPEPHLIPPGTPMLLEALVSADEGLDPYIVWYNGKTRISGGSYSSGAGSFIWNMPASAAFLNLRAESTPFPPINGKSGSGSSVQSLLRGKVKTLSIPVSAKAAIPGILSEMAETLKVEDKAELLNHYRFEGNLEDSLDSSAAKELLPIRAAGGTEKDKKISWLSSGYLYGMAAGPDDAFRLPVFSADAGPEKRSYFRAVLNFKYLADGVIFTAFFNGGKIELSAEKENLVLAVIASDQRREIRSPLTGRDKFLTLPVDFIFESGGVETRMKDEEIYLDLLPQNPGDSVAFQLGGSFLYTEQAPAQEIRPSAPAADLLETELEDTSNAFFEVEDKEAARFSPVIILDELALIRFPDLPLRAASEPEFSEDVAEPEAAGEDSPVPANSEDTRLP